MSKDIPSTWNITKSVVERITITAPMSESKNIIWWLHDNGYSLGVAGTKFNSPNNLFEAKAERKKKLMQ